MLSLQSVKYAILPSLAHASKTTLAQMPLLAEARKQPCVAAQHTVAAGKAPRIELDFVTEPGDDQFSGFRACTSAGLAICILMALLAGQ